MTTNNSECNYDLCDEHVVIHKGGCFICHVLQKFPWYEQVWRWYIQGYLTEQEVEDGVDYLENL